MKTTAAFILKFLVAMLFTIATYSQKGEMTTAAQRINQETIGSIAVRTTIVLSSDQLEDGISKLTRLAQFASGKSNAIFYRFFQNVEQPNQFILFEEWKSITDFQNEVYQLYREKYLNDTSISVTAIKWYRILDNEIEKYNTTDLSFLDTIPATAPTAQKTLDRLKKVNMESSPFVLFVDVPIKEEGIQATRKSVAQIQVETMKEERAIHYGYFQNLEDPSDFLLFEWWTEFDGMNDHLNYLHFTQLMKTFGAFGGDGRKIGLFKPLPY